MAKKVKQWFNILAPKIFNEIQVAETIGMEDTLKGRTLDILVSDLTGDSRKSHLKLKLEISDVKGDKAKTIVKEMSLLRGYMRSIVRRRVSKIDETIDVSTRDHAKLRVKPLIITRQKCNKSQETELRKLIRKVVEDAAKDRTFEAFLLDLISEKLPKDIRQAVSKTYPLKNAEIRKAETISLPRK